MLCNKLKGLQPLWVLVLIRAMPALKAWIAVLRRWRGVPEPQGLVQTAGEIPSSFLTDP